MNPTSRFSPFLASIKLRPALSPQAISKLHDCLFFQYLTADKLWCAAYTSTDTLSARSTTSLPIVTANVTTMLPMLTAHSTTILLMLPTRPSFLLLVPNTILFMLPAHMTTIFPMPTGHHNHVTHTDSAYIPCFRALDAVCFSILPTKISPPNRTGARRELGTKHHRKERSGHQARPPPPTLLFCHHRQSYCYCTVLTCNISFVDTVRTRNSSMQYLSRRKCKDRVGFMLMYKCHYISVHSGI